MRRFTVKAVHQGRLHKGDDLLGGLTDAVKALGIKAGLVSAMGAVSCARIAFYNPGNKVYEEYELCEQLEILNLRGNISMKDDEIFPHVHVTLATRDFKAVGGHLMAGTEVFACEFEIVEFEGPAFARGYDAETGLSLWME